MITRAAFLELHSEFANLPTSRVDRFLELAAQRVGPAYAEHEDDAHRLITAQMLARTPLGAQAKLLRDDGTTIYDAELKALTTTIGTAVGLGEG